MKLSHRLTLLIALLGGGCLVQTLVIRQLRAGRPLPAVPLVESLDAFPSRLGSWHGRDQELTNARATYGDDYLWRIYRHEGTSQEVWLWIVYSASGEDRGHHPEICLAVAGQTEDQRVRRTLNLPGPGSPAQQYRFESGPLGRWVFYWYYTLQSKRDPELGPLARFYQRMGSRASSVTVEVFAPVTTAVNGNDARQFATLVNRALRTHLPQGAVRGSRRSPVVLVEGERY